jgi:hypothetical protein
MRESQLQRPADDLKMLIRPIIVRHQPADRSAAESDFRNPETRVSQRPVKHQKTSIKKECFQNSKIRPASFLKPRHIF